MESVYERYPLVNQGMALVTTPKKHGEGIAMLHGVLVDIAGKIAAAKAAPATDTDSKKEDVLESLYGKDEAGKQAARDYLRSSGILDLVVDYIDDDPSKTFHLAAAMADIVMGYLKTEIAYFKADKTPKTATKSELKGLRADFNEVRDQFNMAANIVCTKVPGFTSEAIVIAKSGKPVSSLTGIQGAGRGSNPHGKYAPVYRLHWMIDNEAELVPNTPLADIVRFLWHGTDRIGKSAQDLAKVLDANVPEWNKGGTFETTFSLNGHEVTVSHGDTDDDDGDEDDSD